MGFCYETTTPKNVRIYKDVTIHLGNFIQYKNLKCHNKYLLHHVMNVMWVLKPNVIYYQQAHTHEYNEKLS